MLSLKLDICCFTFFLTYFFSSLVAWFAYGSQCCLKRKVSDACPSATPQHFFFNLCEASLFSCFLIVCTISYYLGLPEWWLLTRHATPIAKWLGTCSSQFDNERGRVSPAIFALALSIPKYAMVSFLGCPIYIRIPKKWKAFMYVTSHITLLLSNLNPFSWPFWVYFKKMIMFILFH